MTVPDISDIDRLQDAIESLIRAELPQLKTVEFDHFYEHNFPKAGCVIYLNEFEGLTESGDGGLAMELSYVAGIFLASETYSRQDARNTALKFARMVHNRNLANHSPCQVEAVFDDMLHPQEGRHAWVVQWRQAVCLLDDAHDNLFIDHVSSRAKTEENSEVIVGAGIDA